MVVNNELEVKQKEVVVAKLEVLFQNCVEKQRRAQKHRPQQVVSLQNFELGNYWPLLRSVTP